MMHKLVLLRHGESVWNRENRFTGWMDVDLSEKGITEAAEAGRLLKKLEYTFNMTYTSVLKRAIRTLWIILDEMDMMWMPVYRSWRLNERHYGVLQGLNKAETTAKHGKDQVLLWRRSYDVRPPVLERTDERHPIMDPKYKGLSNEELPSTECLKDVTARILPYWNGIIAPVIKLDAKVLIVAHGNSLRALIKHLDSISDDAIVNLNVPTGIPLVYELDEGLKPIKHYYLGDSETVKSAMEDVKNQGKVNR